MLVLLGEQWIWLSRFEEGRVDHSEVRVGGCGHFLSIVSSVGSLLWECSE